MGNYLLIGERLREQREDLGMNQTDFAAVADISRKTLFGYESGDRTPDAGTLAVWAELGVDVLYVITGQRSAPAIPVPGESARDLVRGKALRESGVMIGQVVKDMKESGTFPGSALEKAGLNRREKALLDNYRGSDERGRKAIEGTASALSHKDSDESKHQGGE